MLSLAFTSFRACSTSTVKVVSRPWSLVCRASIESRKRNTSDNVARIVGRLARWQKGCEVPSRGLFPGTRHPEVFSFCTRPSQGQS